MMNRNEFDSYIVGHVKEYLPPSFDNAEMELRTVTKANDVVLTGLSIRREEEQIIPNIYLEPFFDRYQAGESIDKIVGDIADVRIEADRSDKPIDIDILLNYDGLKDRLQIRLCDAEQNRERLKELVSVSDGDYAKTFQVCVGDMSADSYGTISVTPGLMNSWGIQVEQLNADAMAAEDHRGPRLYNLGDMMGHMMAGGEARNLLGNAFPVIPDENQINLYCLTMKDKTFGASLMAREDILAQAATALGESFFILPSSVHEVLLMPESVAMSPQALVTMVQEINQNEVSPQDMLSDKVQYFDKDTGVRENALARQKKPSTENPTEININKSNTDGSNTKGIKDGGIKGVQQFRRYGTFGNVFLTDDEFDRLRHEFPSDYMRRIERLSEYMATTGKRYDNHLSTIERWSRWDSDKSLQSQPPGRSYSHERYRYREGESL